MAIYGNMNRLTLLEYYISNEQSQIESMLPSLNESVSINEGKAWDVIKTIFGKIKDFFKFLKEKISIIIDKIKTAFKRLTSKDEHKPITVHYNFSGKEKELAKEINIEFTEYDVQFITSDLKSNYLREINTLWDAFVEVCQKRINKGNYSDMKHQVEELSTTVENFIKVTNSLKDKYNDKSKKVSIPCTDGLTKAAIMYNSWIGGSQSVVHDLELHERNLQNSIEDLEKGIKELENHVEKYKDADSFKDELGNEVNLKDNLVLFSRIEVYLNKILPSIRLGISIVDTIDKDICTIPDKINGALFKIKYHGKSAKNSNELAKA